VQTINQLTGECLDAGSIFTNLTTKTASSIDRLSVLKKTDSTNNWVKRQPEPGVVVSLAESQTAGRGRRGRQWSSPPGSGILMSLRQPLQHKLGNMGTLSLQVGLAVLTAIQQMTGLPVQLKWPNDVMLDGRKLAGILVELNTTMLDQGHQQITAIIGIGVNVCWPSNVDVPVDLADCSQAKMAVSRNQLAAALINHLFDELHLFASTASASIAARWWQHDLLANQQVTVFHAGQSYIGRAAGIAADGGFVLDMGEHVQTFYSSEASIRLLEPKK